MYFYVRLGDSMLAAYKLSLIKRGRDRGKYKVGLCNGKSTVVCRKSIYIDRKVDVNNVI